MMDRSDNDLILSSGMINSADGTLSTSSSQSSSQLLLNTATTTAAGVSGQICQICGALLKIDSTIQNLNDATYRQLSTPFSSRDEIDTTISGNVDADMDTSLTALVARGGGGCGLERSSAATTNCGGDLDDIEQSVKMYEPFFRAKSMAPRSFYLCPANINIADSNHQSTTMNANELMTGWSTRINATSALFDLMSSNTNVDHPLCEECADQLVNQLDAQCKLIEKEHMDYTNLITKLNQQANNDTELVELEKELTDLESEEQSLLKQIQEAESKEADLLKEVDEKQSEERRLLQEEQIHLLDYSNLKRQLVKLEEKQDSLENQMRNMRLHFNRLRTVSVLNATFHIWHSGPFGTINYFRLGRLPDTPVEWEEINAGLGQVNLLLYCLARKVKLEFQRFRLMPYGNYSYIEAIENCSIHNYAYKAGEELQMHRLKGFRYFYDWDNKFDMAMIAFLDCLQQLERKIKSLDAQFTMPYRINGHKLEDKHSSSSFSIKCQLNSFEEWTKALKYMLTNLKWSLAWVTSNDNEVSNKQQQSEITATNINTINVNNK